VRAETLTAQQADLPPVEPIDDTPGVLVGEAAAVLADGGQIVLEMCPPGTPPPRPSRWPAHCWPLPLTRRTPPVAPRPTPPAGPRPKADPRAETLCPGGESAAWQPGTLAAAGVAAVPGSVGGPLSPWIPR
jgi:hypothetical protein